MPGKNRGYHQQKTKAIKEARLETRRQAVAERIFKDPTERVTQTEVAEEMGVDRKTIHRDVEVLTERAIEAMVDVTREYIAKELRLLERTRTEAWDAWQASKGLVTRKKQKIFGKHDEKTGIVTPSGTAELSEEVEMSHGDPKFLALFLATHDRICKLLKLTPSERDDGYPGDPGNVETNTLIIRDVTPNGNTRH